MKFTWFRLAQVALFFLCLFALYEGDPFTFIIVFCCLCWLFNRAEKLV